MPRADKVAFTDRYLKSLKPAPEGKRTVIWDAAQSNFCVRVSDKGRVSFVLVRRVAGKAQPDWTVLGRYPDISLADARSKARETLGLITEGHNPKVLRKEERRQKQEAAAAAKEQSFAEIAEQFIRRYEDRKLRRGAEVASLIRRELVSVWGDRPIADIKHGDVIRAIEKIVDRRREQQAGGKRSGGPFAARHTFAAAQLLFRWAFERELIPNDPTARIVARKLHGLDKSALRRDRVLTDAEVRVVWAAAEQTSYPFGPLVKLLILTGARLREIADASWDEIDLATATLMVPTSRVKMKAPHSIPLCASATDIVNLLPRFTGGDYLFSTTAGRRPVSGFSKMKARLDSAVAAQARDEGMEMSPWTLHDLRRTMRTGLSSLGVLPVVAELAIGHQQQGIAGVYDVYRYDPEKRDALTRWEARLLDITAPEPEPPAANIVAMHLPRRAQV